MPKKPQLSLISFRVPALVDAYSYLFPALQKHSSHRCIPHDYLFSNRKRPRGASGASVGTPVPVGKSPLGRGPPDEGMTVGKVPVPDG